MRKVTPTLWGLQLQVHKLASKPFTPTANTTLNEKFQISVPAPAAGTYPKLGYLCIGKGAHANSAGADGFPLTYVHQHEPTDAAAYDPVPFVLRLQTNDLPAELRPNYALRRAEVHGGQNYFAYYAKRVNFAASSVDLNRITVIAGVESKVPYVPNSDNLNPTPPNIPADSSIPALPTGDSVEVSSVTVVRLTEFDVAELIEVARIKHNDERYAVISEILLCTGTDVVTTVPGPGGSPMSFTEAAFVQVAQFVTTHEPIEDADDFLELNVDIGSNEGLMTLA